MKKIKSVPEFDRPRKKMEKKGVQALSDLELLAVLLGSGIQGKEVFEVARDIEGVGLAKACQIMAAIEFLKRFLVKEGIQVKNIDDVVKLVEEIWA